MEEAESARPDARATVMIRNIPNKYTQSVMLEVLEKSGFKYAPFFPACLPAQCQPRRPD